MGRANQKKYLMLFLGVCLHRWLKRGRGTLVNVKDYKSNGNTITYTLDYDIFFVNVEHRKTNTGVSVTDLTELFGWLNEQGASAEPLKNFLEFQNSLLLEGETLDFAMSERKMTQKEIESLADKLFDKKISERLEEVSRRNK